VRLSQERSVYRAVTRAVEAALAPYPRQEGLFPALAWPFAGVPVEPGMVREGRAEYHNGFIAGGLEPLAQLQNTYIVAHSGGRGREGLVIVDQHAAHEQVLFERLLGGNGWRPRPPARRR